MGYSRIKTNRKGVEDMEFPLQIAGVIVGSGFSGD